MYNYIFKRLFSIIEVLNKQKSFLNSLISIIFLQKQIEKLCKLIWITFKLQMHIKFKSLE